MRDDEHRWPFVLAGSSVTLAAIGLALAHLLSPGAAIDAVTLALVGIAVLPWLGPIFTSIELPGGVKAQYRERLVEVEKKVAEVEHAFIYGASDHVIGRIGRAITDFSQHLERIGLSVADEMPEVDLGHVPKGRPAIYDPFADKISVDPRLANSPGWALHEFAHVALLSNAATYEPGDGLDTIEGALAIYLTCSFMNSPRMGMNAVRARAWGFDPFWLDRGDHARDLPDLQPHGSARQRSYAVQQRGLIWAQALWQTRTVEGRPEAFDAEAVGAWRSAADARGADEDAFARTLVDRLRQRGLAQHADCFSDFVAARGLAGHFIPGRTAQ
ncbi:hypothetical protein ACFVXG_26695 [Kitasatospora sp. NPDC058162]|uniref:hypothetical protein n=1 Tax=Kitasatospora sp. NPDC058162 TaxID=3346362 RepID=UPI0036DC5776